jgi:hypothetical protein
MILGPSAMAGDSSEQPIEREESTLEPEKANSGERRRTFSCALRLVSTPFSVYSGVIIGFPGVCDTYIFDLLRPSETEHELSALQADHIGPVCH